MCEVTKDSTVMLVPLAIIEHKNTYIIEDVRNNEFYEMSPACVDAIHGFQDGVSLQEIEKQLIVKYPDENIDLIQFVSDLISLNLVLQVDGNAVGSAVAEEIPVVAERDYASGWVNLIGKMLFRSPVVILYLIACIYCIWTLVSKSEYIPEFHDMHVFGSMTVNVLLWAGLSLFLLALHEMSHFLAARSFGIKAKYGFGHRLYFLVLETDISDVWRLPPRQRVIPFIAGMMNDFLMLAITLFARITYPEMSDFAYSILELATLYLCIMLVFQICVFMKTDLYFVLETVSGCLNLKERTHAWLNSLFFKGHSKDKEVFFVKVYTLLYVVGMGWSVWFFVNFAYPQFLHFLDHARDYLSYPVTDYYFWDGVVFLIVNSLSVLLLFYSWARSLRGMMRNFKNKRMMAG